MPNSIHAGLFLQPALLPVNCPPERVICRPHRSTFCCLLQVTENGVKQDESQQTPWYLLCYWHPNRGQPNNRVLPPKHPARILPVLFPAHLGHGSLTCMLAPDHLSLTKTIVASSFNACSEGGHRVWWNCRGHTSSDNPWLSLYSGMCLGEFVSGQWGKESTT